LRALFNLAREKQGIFAFLQNALFTALEPVNGLSKTPFALLYKIWYNVSVGLAAVCREGRLFFGYTQKERICTVWRERRLPY
jgi:hypothetical protein